MLSTNADATPLSATAAGARLAARAGILEHGQSPDWSAQFSPLVLRYPALQCEGLGCDPALLERATDAHLSFLIHAFVEDRILDGQIVLDAEETAFVEAVSRHANAVLRELSDDLPPVCDWRSRLIAGYVRAQTHAYETGGAPNAARIRKVAAGRGNLGALIPLALAAHCGAEARTLRRMKNAFDALMLGLQWLDDLLDWAEDLEHADINLLLSRLRAQGPDPYAHPANGLRIPNVAHALLEGGHFEHAARHAQRWLAHARDRQHQLGCRELAALIENRRLAVPAMAQSTIDDAELRVLAQLTLQTAL